MAAVTLPPYRLTALPPYRLTALPPYRLTAFNEHTTKLSFINLTPTLNPANIYTPAGRYVSIRG
ncbi:hypothetical protein [Neptuniibacter marinus]|uniref:hypothetical protein n=1 Tax=Neptuniibacter marinus TaxID=1806670 RepID=UPI003B5A42F9